MEHLLKAHTLTITPPSGQSSQPKDDAWLSTPNQAIEPPLPMELLRGLSENSDVRGSCLDAISTNTVGLGYTLTVEEGFEHEVADPTKDIQQATAHLEALARRDRRLNPNGASFTELLKAVKWDEEEVGWGFMEVSRDRRTGNISGFFHLPSWRMRRLRERDGYIMLAQDGSIEKDVRFYNFGEKVLYDRDGKPNGRLASPGQGLEPQRGPVLQALLVREPRLRDAARRRPGHRVRGRQEGDRGQRLLLRQLAAPRRP